MKRAYRGKVEEEAVWEDGLSDTEAFEGEDYDVD